MEAIRSRRLAWLPRCCCSRPMTTGARAARPIPLSLTQQYFLDVLVDEGFDPTWQHQVAALEFPTELDATRLPEVVRRVAECHPILDTRLTYRDGEAFLDPCDNDTPPYRQFDLRGKSEAELDLALSRFVDGPFDLMHGPLWRVAFARATGKTILTIVSHHLISDATSGWLVAQDCILGLFGEEVGPGGPSFEEFVLHEREQLSGAELAGRLEYWAKQLDGAVPELLLNRRPSRSQLSSAELLPLICAPDAGELLRAGAKATRSTPLTLLTAIVSAAVARATGTEDVLMGVVTDLRSKKFATTVGPFADLMLIRDRPSAGEDEAQRLARLRNAFFSGWTQHVPVALLRRHIPQLAAKTDRNPCDVFLNFLPSPPLGDSHRALDSEMAPVPYFPQTRIGSPPRRFHAPMYLFLFSLTEKLDGCVFAHHRPELSELNRAMADELSAGMAAWEAPASAHAQASVASTASPANSAPSGE